METQSDQQAQVQPVGELSHSLSNWPEREVAAGLHPQVLGIFIGTYGAMLLALWLLFGTDINALLALGVCTIYFAMYFGVPLVMLRMAERRPAEPDKWSLGRFLKADVDTNTGRVSGWGAVAQLMTIPAGLTGAFIAFGIIIRMGA